MNNEVLQQRHAELQQRLIATRERIRQAEAQLQELANSEQQLLGAIAVVREFIQLQPVEAPSTPTPFVPPTAPPQIQTPSAPPVDNAAQ